MRSERSGPRRPAQDASEVSPVRQLQALLRQNFGAFAERCFYELSPSQTYLHNWHLEALAYHLGEVAAGRAANDFQNT